MRNTLLALTALAGLTASFAAAQPAAAQPMPFVATVQYYGEGYDPRVAEWREREWRHREWEHHRRWEEERRFHEWRRW